MQLPIATICDSATDSNGKLNILGCFDTINAPVFPTVHKDSSIALRITFDASDIGHHRLELKFLDDDGRPCLDPFRVEFDVQVPDNLISSSQNFIFRIQQLRLPKPGNYTWIINYDGEVLTTINVRAIQGKPQQG